MKNFEKEVSLEVNLKEVEDSLFKCYSDFGKISGSINLKNESFVFSDCRPSPWPNNIFNINFDETNYTEVFESIINKIKTKEAPRDIVFKSSLVNDEIDKYLQNDFEVVFNSPAMFINLDNLKPINEPIQNFRVEIIKNQDDLFDWAEVVCRVMLGIEDVEKISSFCKTLKTLSDANQIVCFAGKVSQRTVATSLLHINGNVAGIYHVSVIPEIRGKGYGKRVTYEALAYAKNNGLKRGFLVASDLGKPLYENLGFEEFTRYSKYRLKEA